MKDKKAIQRLIRRYGDIDIAALEAVLVPQLIPIKTLDKNIVRQPGHSHWSARFTVALTKENQVFVQKGRTGKFVPISFLSGGGWREVAKGRILEISKKHAIGEIYTGGPKKDLEKALEELKIGDLWEVDQFGASAKVLSGLVEYQLVRMATAEGFIVRRMPEDIAKHIGGYFHYDFEFEKAGVTKKVEVKSLWGTNLRYARLIHSKGGGYQTSSCKFETQDIFAVSLFLRTGKIADFAFARSVPATLKKYGLPCSSSHSDHVHQNPLCTLNDGVWFPKISDVWKLK